MNVPAVQSDAPPRLPTIQAGASVRAIVPSDFDAAWRIANAVVKSGMAPRGIDTAEKAMVAILHGLEVGMTPMMALQSIAPINGRPAIFGDGALGLVQGSGMLEWHKEYYRGEPETDGYTAVCEVKRRGDPEIKIGEFSIGDAKLAQLYGKDGPWKTYRKRMLKMRARGFALRDGFSDVLRGLHIAEEAQDILPVRDITPRDDGPPAPPPQVTHQPALPMESVKAAEMVTVETAPAEVGDFGIPPLLDRARNGVGAKPATKDALDDTSKLKLFLETTDLKLQAINDIEILQDYWNDKIAPRVDGLFPPDAEEAMAIFQKHERRLGAD